MNRARNVTRRQALVLGGVFVALLVVVLAVQVARTALALGAAQDEITQVRGDLAELDLEATERSLGELSDAAGTARSSSDGLLWGAVTVLPVVGDDFAAVRDLAAALDTVVGAAPAGVDAVARVSQQDLRTDDGGIDLELVAALRPDLQQVADAAAAASRTVADVDPDRLVGRLATQSETFLEQLEDLRTASRGGALATEVLPTLLGADGERRYLLVAQNNAEIRSTGGLPGSASTVTADGGVVELGFQGDAGDLIGTGERRPVADFLPGEEQAFGPLLLSDFRDTNFTPDFPRAASLMAAFADRGRDEQVDGVVSVDPVLLAQVLKSTGPVVVQGRELTADNAVDELLFTTYQRLPDLDQQDAFFQDAAFEVFSAVLRPGGDQAALLRTLTDGISQRRFQVWIADAGLQDRLDRTRVAGALPVGTGRPEVGLYLNDGTQGKMQYFLRSDARIVSEGCDREGRQRTLVRLVLRNEVTTPVDELSEYVTGLEEIVPPGDSLMQLRIFSPEGGELLGLEVDGERTQIGQGEVYGLQYSQTRVQLGPGRSTELQMQFAGAPGDAGDPRLRWTPGIEWAPTEQVAATQCQTG